MGLIFVGHVSVVMTLRPPANLRRRATQSTVFPIVMIGTLISLAGWIAAGVVAAFAFEMAKRESAFNVPGVPNVPYSLGIVLIALLVTPPLVFMARRSLLHLAIQYAIFFAIFVWLIPLAVSGR